jgi:BREX protein BrxB
MEDIAKKFDHLYKVISTKEFLNKESLGGEIPFFISAFDPKQQNDVTKSIKGLKNKLEKKGIPVLEINLYDISMEIINSELGEGEIFELEKEMDKTEFKQALQSILDINQVLIPKIKNMIESQDAKVYFLTGIGLVYPFLRSHNILNNLQNVAKEAPTLAFFPGDYNGQSLELFSLLKDDNYYRAFNIEQYKLAK